MVTACIVLLYISYSIPIVLLLIQGRDNIKHGPFWLGGLGLVANYVTLFWTAFTLIMYSFPYGKPVLPSSRSIIFNVRGDAKTKTDTFTCSYELRICRLRSRLRFRNGILVPRWQTFIPLKRRESCKSRATCRRCFCTINYHPDKIFFNMFLGSWLLRVSLSADAWGKHSDGDCEGWSTYTQFI